MYSVDDVVWSDEWFCSLPQRQKLLYLYLLGICSKCGIFEINVRKTNFDLTNGTERIQPYTHDEIVSFAGDRIKEFAPSKGIIVGFIAYNWMRDKPLDPGRNPLHKGLLSELRKYGLTFEQINSWSSHKISYVGMQENEPVVDAPAPVVAKPESPVKELFSLDMEDEELKKSSLPIDEWFDKFWESYPKSCPRKQDKKKCREKFAKILKASKDPESMFNKIMSGLEVWKKCDTWTKDGGAYIRGPLVWINNENWNDAPMSASASGTSRIVNIISGGVEHGDEDAF